MLRSYYCLGWGEGVGAAGGEVLLAKDDDRGIKRLLYYINLLSWNFPKQIWTSHDYKCNQEINSCFV